MKGIKGRFVIVRASLFGPVAWDAPTMKSMTGLLMAFLQGSLGDKTATLWEKRRGEWMPVFPYQHGGPEVSYELDEVPF